ncbi:MAG: NYN domain-containing protein [Syntrophaceae bacterium]|nr:NYN domain-containing protein [Syntrophaceae bacterium]
MFEPKVDRIRELSEIYPERIKELETIFSGKTNVYIDFANVHGWQEKLGWHVEIKRLKQLLDSFSSVEKVRFYNGTLLGDDKSELLIKDAQKYGYMVVTKPVKLMKLSVDVSGISSDSPDVLKQFIRAPLLHKMDVETIRYLNTRLRNLNKLGILYFEDRKCNFDVEIGRDMLLDFAKGEADHFVLWSGDSDFADPIRQLLTDGKKVVIFATARRVATELNELRESGLRIFDIQKIRDFICWKREIKSVKSKKDSIS